MFFSLIADVLLLSWFRNIDIISTKVNIKAGFLNSQLKMEWIKNNIRVNSKNILFSFRFFTILAKNFQEIYIKGIIKSNPPSHKSCKNSLCPVVKLPIASKGNFKSSILFNWYVVFIYLKQSRPTPKNGWSKNIKIWANQIFKRDKIETSSLPKRWNFATGDVSMANVFNINNTIYIEK